MPTLATLELRLGKGALQADTACPEATAAATLNVVLRSPQWQAAADGACSVLLGDRNIDEDIWDRTLAFSLARAGTVSKLLPALVRRVDPGIVSEMPWVTPSLPVNS